MKKMKTRSKVLLTILGIVIAIAAIITGSKVVNKLTIPEYEYIDNGYYASGTLIIEGTVYEEIGEDTYDELFEKYQFEANSEIGGTFIYEFGSKTQEYRISGRTSSDDKVILVAKANVFTNDNVYPELFFCRQDTLYSYLNLTKYEYVSDGYIIKGNDVIYREIDEKTFEKISDEFTKQNIYAFAYQIVGSIDYNYADKWKFVLHGIKNQEERILLKGKEQYAFYDEDYPEIYFCREDIYNLFKEHGTVEDIDLHEYMQ